jgi:flagellar hook-associated protein 2
VDYLSDKGFSITLDGTTTTIKGPTKTELEEAAGKNWTSADYITLLNEKLRTLGTTSSGDNKITAANVDENGEMKLQFTTSNSAATFQVKLSSSVVGEAIGLSGSLSNYVDTSDSVGSLMDLSPYASTGTDSDGKALYELQINDTTIEFTADTTLESLLKKISSSDAGVSASYSQTTKNFTFTAKDTGSAGRIDFQDDISKALFGEKVTEDVTDDQGNVTTKANYTAGQDAALTAVVNGQAVELNPTSNTVKIDGLSVKLKGTFDGRVNGNDTDTTNAVTFDISSDADTIVEAVKSMINDYNTMVSKIRTTYTTAPAQKSNGDRYEPLSDDDKADMSDTAIENYETKAKQGLLYMDSDLNSLYNGLTNCFAVSGLSSIGITTSYSSSATTIELDESKLREALEEDPDSVRDLFTSSTSSGGTYDGLMTKLSTQLTRYAGTTGATKGILIEKAGSSLASTSLTSNTWYKAISTLEEQIEKWQDKMSDKVDSYTTMYTKLEELISEMNSQSSALSSMTSSY